MGGKATSAGMEFQENVATWMAVQILAGPACSHKLSLPAGVSVDGLICESAEHIDDINCPLSNSGHLYIQCKTSIGLGDESQEIRKVIEQFTRQFLIGGKEDRFVLALSQTASTRARDDLRSLLQKLRDKTGEIRKSTLASLNESEKTLLNLLHKLADESFSKTSPSKISEDDRFRFFSRIHVIPFDFEVAGNSLEQAADQLSAINRLEPMLFSPDRASIAWKTLLATVRTFGRERTGGDRSYFRDVLIHGGVYVRPDQRFAQAIAALKTASGDFVKQISRHSSIDLNGNKVEIVRPLVAQILDDLEDGDLALAGEAGAGKSGVLSAIASRLNGNHDLVVLPVDLIRDGQNLVSLGAELRLPAGFSLIDILAEWTGEKPGYILIDALDAARTQQGLQTLCDLIRVVRERARRWRVVATIREFDFEKSKATQRLFEGTLIHCQGHDRFAGLRVPCVPPLTDDELLQPQRQVPNLEVAFNASGGRLRDLARNVFNLSLLLELLSDGVAANDVASVATQNELLDRYWDLRIVGPDSDGMGREHTLRIITSRMVQMRRLAVDMVVEDSRTVIEDIASRSVISISKSGRLAQDPKRIAYSHNLLFDYAVSRLYINRLDDDVICSLVREPDLLLVLRPSLRIAFQQLWHHDRTAFWERAIAWHSWSEMPAIGMIIAPEIAAEEFCRLQDVATLIDRIRSSNDTHALNLLRAMLVAALSRTRTRRTTICLVGKSAVEWLPLCNSIALEFPGTFNWELRNVLQAILLEIEKHRVTLSESQWEEFASISRLLIYQTIGDVQLLDVLEVAIWASAVSAAASPDNILAMRSVLREDVIAHSGYRILPRLARELASLSRVDEAFVLDLFDSYFLTDASSDESTHLGTVVVPMRSNKRQDLQMFEYSVSEALPDITKASPEFALLLASKCVGAKTSEMPRRGGAKEAQSYPFQFRGRNCQYIPDGSSFWDREYSNRELWHKVSSAALQRLDDENNSEEDLEGFLDIVADVVKHALLWKWILQAGLRSPQRVGLKLLGLLTADPVLRGWETRDTAGQLIKVIYPSLAQCDREAVERAILQVRIPPAGEEERRKSFEVASRSLIACLERDLISLEVVRKQYDELLESNELSPPRPPFSISSGWMSDDEVDRMHGIEIDVEPNKSFRSLQKNIELFCRALSEMNDDGVRTNHALLLKYKSRVATADADGIDKVLLQYSEGRIAEGYRKLSEYESLASLPDILRDVRSGLLEASEKPDPHYSEMEDSDFDSECPMWGSPFSRIEGAQGLLNLIASGACIDEDVVLAVERLSTDHSAAVRFQVVARLGILFGKTPELFTRVAEHVALTEEKLALLRQCVEILSRVGPHHRLAPWCLKLVEQIEARIESREGREIVSEVAIPLYLRRLLHLNDTTAKSRLDSVIGDPTTRSKELLQIIQACEEIAGAPFSTRSHTEPEVLRIAQEMLIRIFAGAIDGLSTRGSEWNAAIPTDEARAAYYKYSLPVDMIAGTVCQLISGTNFPSGEASDDQLTRVYDAVQRHRPLIEAVLTTSRAEPAYQLLRLFRFLIPAVPAESLTWTAKLVASAETSGLAWDPMVASTAVEIVETYLASQKPLLLGDASLRTYLVELLNRFVQRNWPEARDLVDRLDEVFRG